MTADWMLGCEAMRAAKQRWRIQSELGIPAWSRKSRPRKITNRGRHRILVHKIKINIVQSAVWRGRQPLEKKGQPRKWEKGDRGGGTPRGNG